MVAAGRPFPPNKKSAATKAYRPIHTQINNLKNNPKNNLKNNPKNNPKNRSKRKMDNRDANLQAVMDDPAISSMKMSDGTSATVPVLNDITWTDLYP